MIALFRRLRISTVGSSKFLIPNRSIAYGEGQKESSQLHRVRSCQYARSISNAASTASPQRHDVLSKAEEEGCKSSNDRYFEAWMRRYKELCEYKNEFGHLRVPLRYKENRSLGAWVILQRQKYNQMLHASTEDNEDQEDVNDRSLCSLTDEQIALLNEIDFIWKFNDEMWGKRYVELCEYYAKYGDCMVPRLYGENPQLGHWVRSQRERYLLWRDGEAGSGTTSTNLRSAMTEEQIALLEHIGFVWFPIDELWELRFKELCYFQQEFGHCKVPNSYAKHPALGRWVFRQRHRNKLWKAGKLSSRIERQMRDREDRLNKIGFVW
uniref:Helicase-associated domain-containing protein n=1 Tax=Leptocylindrus danicus TaxID=163516 RepID=A0A7S2L246_9STRA|mmetsp:Transcript_3034/g.4382  ORF Transcript_3034/g.4382 Transcript_3034/m.4382 type:complete len:324 (+) Transcript_3034:99-1070(+)|eukprot:CAMPEP_0116020730 /NCGR_PEP_ID=MMETSP0321-20121206/9970_1 /TAXON_ID=163516 /ORGANISM="Leptocylindrus danicus var. danicus, Strain B650" /LENGTH=323 /DNA_ID=CAMNT_0003491475 /DNA_START=11 /DNA_END=979 /DNA_ORIENTATION=+